MQDILLQSLGGTLTFRNYFNLFWIVKVKPNFHISVIDFDQQVRLHHSVKDSFRYHRVNIDGMTPGKDWPWTLFLANHQNKANLVA